MFQLVQIIPQLTAAAGVAQLAQGFGFNLPNPLPGHIELLAHLFQCPASPVLKTESEAEHLPFAGGEAGQNLIDLLLEQLLGGGVNGG